MIHILFALLFFSLQTAFPSYAAGITLQETLSQADKLAEKSWHDVRPKTPGWQYRISPPFPVSWPKKDARVIFYAFATMIDIQKVSGGEHIAAPWATIELDAKNPAPPTITLKEKKLTDIGIQGVRPLKKEELAAYKEMDAAQSAVLAPSGKDNAVIKRAYCVWIKNNPVIAEQIKPARQSFFDWLECK